MRDDVMVVYATCGTLEEARLIGRALVEERLAACVHVRAHEAIYRWDGVVEDGAEWGLVIKTAGSTVDRVVARVTAMNSYTLPGIVAVPVTGGLSRYLDWVAGEVD